MSWLFSLFLSLFQYPEKGGDRTVLRTLCAGPSCQLPSSHTVPPGRHMTYLKGSCRPSDEIQWEFGKHARPRRGQERPRGSPGEALERQGPPGGPKWPPGEAQERSTRGPGEPQERPWSPTGTRPEGKGQEETRADKSSGRTRQQADKRSSGATKPRTPWPVSNLLLVHVMHGSTLVYRSLGVLQTGNSPKRGVCVHLVQFNILGFVYIFIYSRVDPCIKCTRSKLDTC